MKSAPFLFLCLLCSSLSVKALSLDEKLSKIIEVYQLQSGGCTKFLQKTDHSLVHAGKVIFETTEFSGDNDTSCKTCHIEEKALTDGLKVAVGVGGTGESLERLASGGIVVPRNAFTLRGRAHKDFRTYFWDGKVAIDGSGKIFSPFGDDIDPKFSSPLAVAAILPFLARDEFLGELSFFDENKHIYEINDEYYQARYLAASRLFKEKILTSDSENLQKIRNLLSQSGTNLETLTLADIGNALAAFIAEEFSCGEESRWSKYLNGSKTALSDTEKRGAIQFYGAGRCSGCHVGNLFSDFEFHSIASPQGNVGTSPLKQDLGRAEVTHIHSDRYLFRTPPLIDVANTAPYGHSGQFPTLESIVLHHINHILFMKTYEWSSDDEMMLYGKMLGQRSYVLTLYDINTKQAINEILSFLNTL